MRILIISYYFPPFMNVGGFRAMSWARRFHDAGHEVTVIKGEGREAASCAYFEERLGRDVRTLSVRNPLLAEGGDVHEQPRLSRLEGLKDALRKHIPVLDGYVAWARAATAAAVEEEAARGRFDAVVSTSFPLSAHEAAWRFKSRRDLVWVGDFRDFYGQFGSNAIDPKSGRGRFLSRRISAYGRAMDLATTVSIRLQNLLAGWIPETPTLVLYNGYFKEHLPPIESEEADWSILYTGSYNAEEFTLAPLAEAMVLLKDQGIHPPEIRFTGGRNEAVEEAFRSVGIVPRFLGAVRNQDALRLQRKAGFLLVCDAMSGPGALLTKTFEYLAARRPVIAITRKGSDLRETVFAEKAPGYITSTEAKEIADFIVNWKERGLGATDGAFYPEERIETYSRERQADVLLARIEAIILGRRKA